MNNDILAGKWKQFTGKIKETFGKLTVDDLARAEGNAEVMAGLLQERYGYTKEQARKSWDDFVEGLGVGRKNLAGQAADMTEQAKTELEKRLK